MFLNLLELKRKKSQADRKTRYIFPTIIPNCPQSTGSDNFYPLSCQDAICTKKRPSNPGAAPLGRLPVPKHRALSPPTPDSSHGPSSSSLDWFSVALRAGSPGCLSLSFSLPLRCLLSLSLSQSSISPPRRLWISESSEDRRGVPGWAGLSLAQTALGEDSQRPFLPSAAVGQGGRIPVSGSQCPLCHLSCLHSSFLLINTLPPPLPVLPPRLPSSGSPVTAAQSSKAAGPRES